MWSKSGHRRRARRYQTAEERRHPDLGTAVYSASQGPLAALAGAKYVAPYVNRVDAQGGDGIRMVQELQSLLEMACAEQSSGGKLQNATPALDCLLAGCEAITLPLDVAQQMLGTPAVESAIEKFEQDWNNAFGTLNL